MIFVSVTLPLFTFLKVLHFTVEEKAQFGCFQAKIRERADLRNALEIHTTVYKICLTTLQLQDRSNRSNKEHSVIKTVCGCVKLLNGELGILGLRLIFPGIQIQSSRLIYVYYASILFVHKNIEIPKRKKYVEMHPKSGITKLMHPE